MKTRRIAERPLWTAHPSWKGMIGWYIKWEGLALLFSALAILLHQKGHLELPPTVFIVLLLNGLALGIGWLLRRTTTYTITSKRVSGRKRIPSRAFRLILEEAPIARIDNITVDQGLIEQMLGVGTIDFDTAGDRDRDSDILRWWGVVAPQQVARKIENVVSGDPWDNEDEEEDSPYLQTEPRLAARGYIEEEE